MTAAHELARMIREYVPGWTETSDQPGHWRFTDPDEDYGGRYVEVDGTEREQVAVAHPMEGIPTGPQIWAHVPKLVGYSGGERDGISLFVVLPAMVDRTELRDVIRAAAAIGAMPGERWARR